MKLRLFASTLVIGFAMSAAASFACPEHENKTASGAKAGTPCGAKTAVTIADKVEDGRSETAKTVKKGGCSKPCGGAKTAVAVSDKAPCDKPCCAKAAKASAKAPCSGSKTATASAKSPCGGGKAVTASAKSPCGKNCDKPCCAKAAKASAKSPCHGGTAATASAKSPCSKPCGAAKTAVTASAKAPCGKDCDKPCCGKAAKASAKAPCSKPCGSKTASADGSGDCPIGKKISAVLASMPSMKYRVGDEVTGCSKSAAAMATKAHTKIAYVVGDDTFKTEGEATVQLVSALETELGNLQAVQYVAAGKCMRCPVTAKGIAKKAGTKMTYRVAGVDFDDKATAEKTAKLVSDAVATVSMKYKVGEKSFCCDKMAGAAVKDSGKKMVYVVAGEETSSSVSAKSLLTQAKLRKAVETAVKSSLSL